MIKVIKQRIRNGDILAGMCESINHDWVQDTVFLLIVDARIFFILYVKETHLQKDLETNISYKVFSTIPNQLALHVYLWLLTIREVQNFCNYKRLVAQGNCLINCSKFLYFPFSKSLCLIYVK